jgi:hypothetical protein
MAELVVSRTQWLPLLRGAVAGGRLRRRGPSYRNTTIRSVLKNLWSWLLKARDKALEIIQDCLSLVPRSENTGTVD